jgi:hypothetical protein
MPEPAFEPPTELLLGDLQAVIRDEARGAARSQQVAIGPSELGQACERKLALGLLGAPAINDDRDDWTATVGTACHKWMEKAFINANERLAAQGQPARWLVETEIDIRTGLIGHVDVYDIWTHTVLDHKFPGVTAIRKYRRQGHPGRQYRWQGHVYGFGWKRLGLPVETVATCMYPRSGLIRDSWLWKEPYSEAVALEAFKRTDDLLTGMDIAEQLGSLPEFMQMLARDTENCGWCKYFKRGHDDPTTGCQGPWETPGYEEPGGSVIKGLL